jgi:hypothetical protein
VRRTTIRKRMRAKLRQIKQQLRERMDDPLPQTGQWLQSIVQGYFNYYAVPGNLTSPGGVPRSGACSLVAYHSPTEPETPDPLDAHGPSDGSLNRVRSIPFLTLASPGGGYHAEWYPDRVHQSSTKTFLQAIAYADI